MTAFSCGARSAFMLKGEGYLRSMLSRRQLQGFVMRGVSGARISPSFLIKVTGPLCRTTLSKAPFSDEKLE